MTDESVLITVQSTAVILLSVLLGNRQALPAGSGNLEMRISPSYISKQFRWWNVVSEMYLAF